MGSKTPKNAFWNYFEDLDDPRCSGRNFTYSLKDIISLAVLGICCEQRSFLSIAEFLEMQWRWFQPHFPDCPSAPSRHTFSRVFEGLDSKHFESCFIAWTESKRCDGGVVAIDGKTVRNSGVGSERPLHLVSAWSSKSGLVLGQIKTEEKSNEITAIPKLIEILNLEGCVVTIDAMGCQKSIASAICDASADYVLALKDNHKTMAEEVTETFRAIENGELEATDSFEDLDKGHGRIEQRRCVITTDIDWFKNLKEWKNLACFVMVQAIRIIGDKTTVANRYYISSLKNITAQEMLDITRRHWEVENKHHWCMDVVFGEDKACIREKNLAQNIAAARRCAMNTLRKLPGYKGLTNARRTAAFNLEFRQELVKSIT